MSYNINPVESFDRIDNSERPTTGGRVHSTDEFGYEFVRYGEKTTKTFSHKKVLDDVKTLLKKYNDIGYGKSIPILKNFEFRKEIAKFRATLDLYETIPCKKVFSKDEIYVRSLEEGHKFTEFIKKSRAMTLKGLTSITEIEIEEEYFHPENYEGYDSIIHERNLIHWDDREDVDDIKYAFMESTTKGKGFKNIFKEFLKSISLEPEAFDTSVDQLGELKNTKMYDPVRRTANLMREFWTEEIDLDQPYFAKRAIVPVYPGGTRDTGIGDPSTIAKVKLITKICRTILERCPHSASAPAKVVSERLMRVLKKNTFLHLDFKKYGLAFPRVLQNIALGTIGEVYKLDVSNLIIDAVFIEIDDKIYETVRGVMLGWVDCLNELIVHSLLYHVQQQGVAMDWIAFNDDVEISYYTVSQNMVTKSEMIREVILSTINIYDILISISKTYASQASLFLEKYFKFDKYKLNMEKRQLAIKLYAQSLVSREPWLAKLNFAAAYNVYTNDEIISRCMLTCPVEFTREERDMSLFCGGWLPGSTNLDRSLENQTKKFINLACELQKIQIPNISLKPVNTTKPKEILRYKQKVLPKARSPEEARERFQMEDTRYDVNFEVDGVLDTYQTRYVDKNKRSTEFNSAYRRILDRIRVFDPG